MERRQTPARASERAPNKRCMNGAATAGSAAIGIMTPDNSQGTASMKATAAIHAIALAACFTAHLAFAGEFDGVRRALQTMAAAQAHPVAPVIVAGTPVAMTA